MAVAVAIWFHLILLHIFLFLPTIFSKNGCYKSIFSFGDSLTDTGNFLAISPPDHLAPSAFPPYGKVYFHRPTGRCSDGRLVIDFISQYLGLPLVPPYFGGNVESFKQGVNFAVEGATALDYTFFEERGFHNPTTNISLNVQLTLFKELLPSLCSTPSDCKELLKNSLVLMGEIGGNDYNHPFLDGFMAEDVQELVPLVVNAISLAIKELIVLGAVTILVPGNMPLGCVPCYLTHFKTYNMDDYDAFGCLKWLNAFSNNHNEQLQLELNRIQELHPHTSIIYADYYSIALQFYRSPNQFGFTQTLKACCGVGGSYNYDQSQSCGHPLTGCCHDPSKYINWDGVHFTEATYALISKAILEGPYTTPQYNSSCIMRMTELPIMDSWDESSS